MPTWRGALPEEHLWALAYYVKSVSALRGTDQATELARKFADQAPFVPTVEKAGEEDS